MAEMGGRNERNTQLTGRRGDEGKAGLLFYLKVGNFQPTKLGHFGPTLTFYDCLALPIHVPPMSHPDNEDQEDRILNLVDESVIADSDAIDVLGS